MNENSPMLLIGIGTAGCAMTRGVRRAFGSDLRYVLIDTAAASGLEDENFILIGGDRLSGHGTGGDFVAGRCAAEDSIKMIDEHLEGVRMAIIVTALGGGTGSGATLETVKYLSSHGIPSVVFATYPFTFEGESQQRNARGVTAMIEDAANCTFLLPLDKLINGIDNMDEAMRRAIDTIASGVTLFWRLLEKPGYIRLDVERLRHLCASAGRGRFAVVTAQGPDRAQDAISQLISSPMLTTSSGPVKSMICGILAGNDLLLSEVGMIADGLKQAFNDCSINLATVNDEATFSGRLTVVTMLFESNPTAGTHAVRAGGDIRRTARESAGHSAGGRFKNSAPTIWNGEDLDTPTFIRKGIQIDL